MMNFSYYMEKGFIFSLSLLDLRAELKFVYTFLVEEAQGKRSPGRNWQILKNNIKTDRIT